MTLGPTLSVEGEKYGKVNVVSEGRAGTKGGVPVHIQGSVRVRRTDAEDPSMSSQGIGILFCRWQRALKAGSPAMMQGDPVCDFTREANSQGAKGGSWIPGGLGPSDPSTYSLSSTTPFVNKWPSAILASIIFC